jgi:hypothetical protein
MNDRTLDALLAEYAPPPLPAGLAGRAVAAALALPQKPRPASALPRHDRSRVWLRRPMLIGGIALGLAVSGAVAATLAGIRLDKLPGVEAVLARLPFAGHEPAPEAVSPPRPVPVRQAVPVVEAAPAPGEPVATPRLAELPAPRAPAVREEAPPVAAPEEAPRPETVETRRVEMPPSAPLAPAARQEDAPAVTVAERRDPAPAADEPLRLQREQLERTERLRAARQAQIERMQRRQQSRERIRRLRRD